MTTYSHDIHLSKDDPTVMKAMIYREGKHHPDVKDMLEHPRKVEGSDDLVCLVAGDSNMIFLERFAKIGSWGNEISPAQTEAEGQVKERLKAELEASQAHLTSWTSYEDDGEPPMMHINL